MHLPMLVPNGNVKTLAIRPYPEDGVTEEERNKARIQARAWAIIGGTGGISC